MADILQFIPPQAEKGAGLVIKREEHYLFFLPGKRFLSRPETLFFAGIGGHLEKGETFLACARREAREEVGADIVVESAPCTFFVYDSGRVERISVDEEPRPLGIYAMIHPRGTPKAGQVYYIVIYAACMPVITSNLQREEVGGIIGLSRPQIIQSLKRKVSLADLVKEGAYLWRPAPHIKEQMILYPQGTARACAYILKAGFKI